MNIIMKHWAKAAYFIGITILVLKSKFVFNHVESLAWFHVSILMFHQSEEYWFPGGFKDFFNKNIYRNKLMKVSLNDCGIIAVNIILGWTIYIIAALYPDNFELSLILISITLSNGLLHTFIGIKNRSYIPGLFTSIIFFLPFGIYMINYFSSRMEVQRLILFLLLGLLANGAVPLVLKLTNSIRFCADSENS